MKVINGFPPNWRAIQDAFNVRGRQVAICYGDTIYVPTRWKLPPEILTHERVHSDQQGSNPVEWWDRYIEDSDFRLAMEIPAHIAEYQDLVARGGSRNLEGIAQRLASPLYGSLISIGKARELIGGANGTGNTTT